MTNRRIKGKFHVGNHLKHVFGYAEHQENGTYGLRYEIGLR